jgi:hypothetical protein
LGEYSGLEANSNFRAEPDQLARRELVNLARHELADPRLLDVEHLADLRV